MSASQLTYLEPTDSEEEDSSATLAEGRIYDFINNEPVKDGLKERALQAVARSLVYEYGFDHTQLERDVTVTYEVTDPHGRTKRTRRKVDLVVYPEGKPKELKHIVRVGIVQPPEHHLPRGAGTASPGGRPFNKLIVFDEAHKYMDNPDLTGHIVEVIRQMRHQGVSALIASQDPPSLPNAIIELSSLVILHRFNSPQWFKHVQRSITSLADLTPSQMAALRPGEAFVWANKATERIFTQKAVKMRFRPRVTQHGGETKRAV